VIQNTIRNRATVVDHRIPHEWPRTGEEWDRFATCCDCGLSTLALLVESPEWVTRRVETIEFLDDRTVRRRVSVTYVTPRRGLCLRSGDAAKVRLLPIAIMRRKSLINFNFRDSDDRPVPLIGLRETQKITLGVVFAWAHQALMANNASDEDDLKLIPGTPAERVLRDLIEGDQSELTAAWTIFARTGTSTIRPEESLDEHSRRVLHALWNDRKFAVVLERLVDNFVLFAPDSDPPGRLQIVKFSYDEPLSVRYSKAGYRPHSSPDTKPRYEPQEPRPWWKDPLAGLGLRATLVRFPVPSAELATSFHLEIATPPGASIVEASLLAGLPNLVRDPQPATDKALYADGNGSPTEDAGDPRRERRRPSYDFVGPGYPTVDLHVADVPYGSLSRAQVFLRARPQGWLATSAACAWVASAALWATSSLRPKDAEVAATILVTLAAAFVTLVVREDQHRMVARLLGLLKLVSATSVALLLVGALALAAFNGKYGFVRDCAIASLIPALLVSLPWTLSVYSLRDQGGRKRDRDNLQRLTGRPEPDRPRNGIAQRKELGTRVNLRKQARDAIEHQMFLRESPWEQYRPRGDDGQTDGAPEWQILQSSFASQIGEAPFPYDEAVRLLRFDRPAIRVASAEGARMTFEWTRQLRQEFMERLPELRN
jgi:hypothetical protein